MKLQEIFTHLATGELSQVYLAETGGQDVIADEYLKSMTQSIQLGLTALHSRFTLKEGEVSIKLDAIRTHYPLRSKYSVTKTTTADPKYILDSVELPFRDDILKIERVTTLNHDELPLNMRHEAMSVHTPSSDTVVFPTEIITGIGDVPEEFKTDYFKVHYRANHSSLIPRGGILMPDKIEVELPTSHLQALLYFVASRKTNPIGIVQEFHAGNSWFQKYELECKQLEDNGVGTHVDLTHQRFIKNGWA